MQWKFGILFFLSVSVIMTTSAQESTWKTLAKITYTKQYDELMGFKVDVPVFSEDIMAMEGQIIEVKGYIIPVEGYKSHKEFIFSAFPYTMCFFCGGAGPESVMELRLKKKNSKFNLDEIATFSGILRSSF